MPRTPDLAPALAQQTFNCSKGPRAAFQFDTDASCVAARAQRVGATEMSSDLGVSLRGLSKTYAGGQTVVHGIDLDVHQGEFMVLVGPSGCGKTTTLRMIAGLEHITDGQLLIGGRDVTDLPPAERGVAMVFQSYALYPHMTVAENMGFALRVAGMARAQVDAAVRKAADVLQLGPLLNRKPRELSGGQRQRVAIGRAIVREPQVFLFDEPLSNLDAALRNQMRFELARLHRTLGATIVYVTHDQVEAMTLGERIAVFNAGRIEQVGPPMALYEHPATRFVAGFLGSPSMNFLAAHIVAEAGNWIAEVDTGRRIALPAPSFDATLATTLGVRPEHWHLVADGGLPAQVELIEQLGDSGVVHLRLLDSTQIVTFKTHDGAGAGLTMGARVQLLPDFARALWFGADGRTLNVP
jgi:multiple sugar transport system ATP-binding protein